MSTCTTDLLTAYEPVSTMLHRSTIKLLLECLEEVLQRRIPGAVVELGCNQGTSAMFFRRLLDHRGETREFHVYDSWQGLPEATSMDLAEHDPGAFTEGSVRTAKDVFVGNFRAAGLQLPSIHDGWFREIPDDQYPQPIAFAFLDGDFYSSILDSLDKVYIKLAPGARVCIHDCHNPKLPGARKAVEEFLRDKPEALTVRGNTGLFTKL